MSLLSRRAPEGEASNSNIQSDCGDARHDRVWLGAVTGLIRKVTVQEVILVVYRKYVRGG